MECDRCGVSKVCRVEDTRPVMLGYRYVAIGGIELLVCDHCAKVLLGEEEQDIYYGRSPLECM